MAGGGSSSADWDMSGGDDVNPKPSNFSVDLRNGWSECCESGDALSSNSDSRVVGGTGFSVDGVGRCDDNGVEGDCCPSGIVSKSGVAANMLFSYS